MLKAPGQEHMHKYHNPGSHSVGQNSISTGGKSADLSVGGDSVQYDSKFGPAAFQALLQGLPEDNRRALENQRKAVPPEVKEWVKLQCVVHGSELKEGDAVFWRGVTSVSRFIASMSLPPCSFPFCIPPCIIPCSCGTGYSHSTIVVGNDGQGEVLILQSLDNNMFKQKFGMNGVAVWNLGYYAISRTVDRMAILPARKPLELKFLKFLGIPWESDYLALPRSGAGCLCCCQCCAKNDVTTMFCSELIAAVAKESKCHIKDKPSTYATNELVRCLQKNQNLYHYKLKQIRPFPPDSRGMGLCEYVPRCCFCFPENGAYCPGCDPVNKCCGCYECIGWCCGYCPCCNCFISCWTNHPKSGDTE